ncbi:beta-lactamase superfamily II metal-dependent hydrolase [Salinibacter ruber]|nr:beta-lactamase superfamily II metal-dependent hydrolase [Salinibacter ruber]
MLRVEYGDVNILLPGDIEKAIEQNLVRTYGEKLLDHVVKVPHHGSETSSRPSFVRSASDSTQTHVVVSVGHSSRYGMPDARVIRRWRREARQVHSTADREVVWMRTDGKEVWCLQWQ